MLSCTTYVRGFYGAAKPKSSISYNNVALAGTIGGYPFIPYPYSGGTVSSIFWWTLICRRMSSGKRGGVLKIHVMQHVLYSLGASSFRSARIKTSKAHPPDQMHVPLQDVDKGKKCINKQN